MLNLIRDTLIRVPLFALESQVCTRRTRVFVSLPGLVPRTSRAGVFLQTSAIAQVIGRTVPARHG
jgi:hypothetical protein